MTCDPSIDQMKIVAKIRVTAPSSPPLPASGYQMRINLSSLNQKHSISSNIPQLNVGFGIRQSNFNDLAFVMDGGIVLPHQVIINADGSNKSLPECWIKIPFIPASQSKIVYVLAGHISANRNAGDKCFEFWDHFDVPTLNLQKWNNSTTASISGGVCKIATPATLGSSGDIAAKLSSIVSNDKTIRCRISVSQVNTTTGTMEIQYGLYGSNPYYWCGLGFCSASTERNYKMCNIGYATTTNAISGVSANTYNIVEGIRTSSTSLWKINDTSIGSLPHNFSSNGMLKFYVYNDTAVAQTMNIDWVHVRQYMATEPTITLL